MSFLPRAQKLRKSWRFSSTRQFFIHSGDHPHVSLAVLITFSNPPAWKRLIDPALSMNERADLMTSIFSDRDELEVFEYLSGNDAQAFIEVIGEVSIRALSLLKDVSVESH